jgi:hypothetical protein
LLMSMISAAIETYSAYQSLLQRHRDFRREPVLLWAQGVYPAHFVEDL